MEKIPAGRRARIRVPAQSANLGPGFDALGMAFDWFDECVVESLAEGVEIRVTGEGAGTVPLDRSHLVIACFDQGLADLGCQAPGVRLEAHNTIPHTRGLGSSAAAAVAGLLAAWAFAHPGVEPDPQWLLDQSNLVEGHPDNVAAAIYGGYVLTWSEDDGPHAVTSAVHDDVRILSYVPMNPVSTKAARKALPEQISHRDAAANSGRAALLTYALTQDPSLLQPATRDWLHTDYRIGLMPESARLVTALRERGYGALISGAGPTVLVLTDAEAAQRLDGSEAPGFEFRRLAVGPGACLVP